MKKTILRKFALAACLLGTVAFSGCKYDDDALWDEINGTKDRLTELETKVNSLNGEINAIRTITDAMKGKDWITGVTELPEGNGYTINFQNAEPIVIRNGTDGKNGTNAPQIGVAEIDGTYYWTLDDEPILVAENEKLPVTGNDAIAPKVRINPATLEWEICTDNENWASTGVVAKGDKGDNGESLFCDVDLDDPECVTFTLADETTTLTVPRHNAMQLQFEGLNDMVFEFPGDGQEYSFTYTQSSNISKIGVASTVPQNWKIRIDEPEKKIYVSSTDGGSADILLVATDDAGTTVSYWITFTAENMNLQSAIDALQDGETLRLKAMTYPVKNQINIPAGKTVEGIEGTIIEVEPTSPNSDITGIFLQGGTLRGVTLKYISNRTPGGAWTNIPQGVAFQQLTGGTLENSTITGFRNGIYANNTPNVIIRDNIIEGNRTGIQFANQVSGEVSGNTIRNNETLGFLLLNANGGESHGIPTITNNTFDNNWYGDFENRWSTAYTVDINNNTFTGNTRTLTVAGGAGEPGANESFNKPASQTANIVTAVRTNVTVSDAVIKTTLDKLAAAAANTVDGDLIEVAQGSTEIASTIAVNNAITIKGAANHGSKIEIRGANLSAFKIGAAAVIDGLHIEKTDKTGSSLAIMEVTAAHAVIRNCIIEGQYEDGDAEVVRGIQFNNSLEGTIDGNKFLNVRQPSYVEGPLTITNNYTEGTRGWVVTQNFTPVITGNSFGANAVDIAIITNGLEDMNNYTDDTVRKLHADNNNAHVENQIPGYISIRKNGETYNY